MLGQHGGRLSNHAPLGLLDVVPMNVDIVAVRIKATVEDERSVHERTGIDERAMLTHAHLFDVEDIAPIEDLE